MRQYDCSMQYQRFVTLRFYASRPRLSCLACLATTGDNKYAPHYYSTDLPVNRRIVNSHSVLFIHCIPITGVIELWLIFSACPKTSGYILAR
eukprot:COSAG01_NODE_4263_length_5198_cov_77.376937_6_plen_92_part_00